MRKFLARWKKRIKAKRVIATLVCLHDLKTIPPVQRDDSYTIRILQPEEIAVLREIDDVDLDDIRTWFERGDRCYVAFADGKPAHFRFVQTTGRHKIVPAARWTTIGPGDFWFYAGRTVPWARGRRISPNVILTLLKDYQELGYKRCWTTVVSDNFANRSGLERAGFRYVGSVKSIWIWKYLIPLSWRRLPV